MVNRAEGMSILRKLTFLIWAAFGSSLWWGPASAADGPAAGVETYDRTFFAQFSAISAEDLLKRIPGIQDLLAPATAGLPGGAAVQQRGFGSTGVPILFNGRRLSGKTNDPRAALQRIQARQVVRIDVIRGSVPGLDIRVGAEGAVLNIVLEDELTSGAGSWEASMSYYASGLFKPGGKVSYAGTSGALSYAVSLTGQPFFGRRFTRDTFTLPPATQPFGRIRLIDQNIGTDYVGTGSLGYAFQDGTIANLNGRYAVEEHLLRQPVDNYTISAAGLERYTGSALQLRDSKGDIEWELGGDAEHTFADGDSLRGLFVVTDDKRPTDARFFTTPVGTTLVSMAERYDRQQIVKSQRTERIGRAFYTWAVAPGQSLEAGAEIALNGLDQSIRRLDNVGGVFREAALFNPDSMVDETRLETFLNYGRQMAETLYVEAALDTEQSRLKQRGRDVSSTRTFRFLKPRVDVRFDPIPRTQIRGRVLRTISQLDFANFVSSFSNDDVRLGVLLLGNPNLVPEKTWTFEGTVEQRLAGDRGVISLRGFLNRITDHIDKFPITPAFAGTGNIGNARSFGAEVKMGLRLDGAGLPRATLDATGLVQESSARDSFSGDRRDIVNFPTYRWTIAFRQDTEWHNLAYGFSVNDQDSFIGSDIDFRHRFSFTPEVDVFVETRAAGLTFRAEASRLTRVVHRDRFQFIGNRTAGNLLRREFRFDTFPRTFKAIVRGTF